MKNRVILRQKTCVCVTTNEIYFENYSERHENKQLMNKAILIQLHLQYIFIGMILF
jgi:hypothetical protein